MQVQRGDIIVTMFPFADSARAKMRPALVYAGPWSVGEFSICWILMITSKKRAAWPRDVSISNLEVAGLPGRSLVRVLKVVCIDTRVIVRTIGTLDRKTLRTVRDNFESIK